MFLEFIEFLILRPNLLADEKLLRFMKNLPKQKSHKNILLNLPQNTKIFPPNTK